MAWNLIRNGKTPEKGRTTCACQSQIVTSNLKALPNPTLFKGTDHFSWFPTPSWDLSTKSQTNGFAELSVQSLFQKSYRLTNLNTPVQVGTSASPFLLARSNSLLSVLKSQSNAFPASFSSHTPHLTQQRVYTSPPCSTQNYFETILSPAILCTMFSRLPNTFKQKPKSMYQHRVQSCSRYCPRSPLWLPPCTLLLISSLPTLVLAFTEHQRQLYFLLGTPVPSALPSHRGASPPLPWQFLPFGFAFLHRIYCLKSFLSIYTYLRFCS